MPPARRRRPSRRSYHHGNLRRALLDEALAIIRTEGVAGVTLREIGARVGVSRTALYRHFADKRALLVAVATEGFRTLREQLVSAWEGSGGGIAGFEAHGLAYVRFAVGSPAHYRVMFGGMADHDVEDPELTEQGHGAFQSLLDVLTDLQRVGLVRRDDTLVMAEYVWAVVHGVAMLAIDRQLVNRPDVEAFTRYAISRLATGLASPEA
ncbi:MAG: TetR/AcrR family transcriptional regulator [Gemmatimonadaceae bacterium]|nr:TetR/AcrR family transcriptional regulator [Gemmatimonadaceae bacterium]